MRSVFKSTLAKRTTCQIVTPVVRIARNNGWQLFAAAKKVMAAKMPYLLLTLLLCQPQVPIDNPHGPFGRVDHHQLSASSFLSRQTQGNIVPFEDRPSSK